MELKHWTLFFVAVLFVAVLALAAAVGRIQDDTWKVEDRVEALERGQGIVQEDLGALAGIVLATPTPWPHEIEVQAPPPVTVLIPFPLMEGVSEQELRWCFLWVSYDQVGNCLWQMAENGEP